MRYKRIYRIIGLFFLVYSTQLSAQNLDTIPKQGGPLREKFLMPKEMKEDLDTLFSALSGIHPNLYFNISKEEFDDLKAEVYSRINDSLSVTDFWKLTAPVVAKLEDGHTILWMPREEWEQQLHLGAKIIFPLLLDITKDNVAVSKNLSAAPIESGDYLLSINHNPIEEIINNLVQYISSELYHKKLKLVEWQFSQMLFVVYGYRGPFEVEIRNSQGEVKKYSLEGIDASTYDAGRATFYYGGFRFEEIPELKTGIIRFIQFSNRKEFNKFLEKTFREIKQKKYKYLIIDLRANEGGDSRIAEDLLNYLTNRPYRFFGGEQWKVSKYIREFISEYFPEYATELEKYPIDSVYTLGDTAKAPPENILRFKGRIFVLISNYTASTASGFAAVIKDFGIATLVGEETGGLPSSYGDICYVTLPNSYLDLGVSWKYFIRPSGDPEYVLHGVMPDIYVKTTAEDQRKGIDPVIEKVKETIRKDLTKSK